MKAELFTKRFMRCPNGCAHEFAVEHLFTGQLTLTSKHGKSTAGPWYCDDCGQGWRLSYTKDSIDLTAYDGGASNHGADGKKRNDWVILELPPQTEPVRFKVRGIRFTKEIDEDNRRYFYEQHTCPVNWLGDVAEVSIGDDSDPHGLWKLISVFEEKAN